MTDKEIKKIKKDYMNGLTYKQIQEKHSIEPNQLKWIIQKNKWKRPSNRRKAQKGNKNAVGNKGGPGAGEGNKNSLTTGEYETIFFEVLTDKEKELYQACKIEDKKQSILEEIKLITIREYRIMNRIKKLQEKDKDMVVDSITKRQYKSIIADNTETATQVISIITPLQKLEDALTRVQDQKRRCIDSLHKIENDDRRLELEIIRLEMEAARESEKDPENTKDDSFIKALDDSVESAWDDYEQTE